MGQLMRWWRALAIGLVALGATACTDDAPQPAHTYAIPTPGPGASGSGGTSSTAATPTGPVTVGPVPAAARADTVEGAKAFVSAFYGRLNGALTRPQEDWLTDVCAPKTPYCSYYVKAQGQLRDKGWRAEQAPFAARGMEELSYSTTHERVFQFLLRKAEVRFVDGRGAVRGRERPETVVANVMVVRRGDSWRLADFEVAKVQT
ncbi:hypothetical protein [Angustibacter aerolatus]